MSLYQLPETLLKLLKERQQRGLLRTLKKEFPSIDFCSNDYLGFSKNGLLSKAIKETAPSESNTFGSTGSRLISGNSTFTEETEKHIALFHHGQSALIFNSGYDANLGLFSSVPQKGDLILFDEFIHASIYDGIRLSHATYYKFKHNDMLSLQELLNRHKASFENVFIAVESVYSMDGDTAPLLEIVELCRQSKNIFLIVDEAHAIGIFGRQGRGLCNALNIEKKCFARLYTFGKAMGCHGAAVVGDAMLREYLVNFSRSFIYTTALPEHSVNAIATAYKLLIETNEQEKLQQNIAYFYSRTGEINQLIKSQSAIHSLLVGSNEKAEELESLLASNNVFAKAIKSPTVKAGTERVRFCIHSFNTPQELDVLINIINVF